MSEPHTADLGTRYRYRQEGAQLERERLIEILQMNRKLHAKQHKNDKCTETYCTMIDGLIESLRILVEANNGR